MADNRDFRPWESGLRIDLPEFQGGLTPEEFLDWVAAMDEVLEFKQVPEDKRVSLVATRFRGRAAAWWQQLKQTRMRQGKGKISSWEKLKKKMRVAFLPHNYSRLMYQRLQNLRQNSRSVDDYTTEFHQLVARNDLAETEEQLVSRSVGGLREQFQFTLNMFELFSISDAYQKALQIEKQAICRPSSTPWSATAQPTVGNTSTKPIASLPPTNLPTIRAGASSGSGSKCFKCGEPGHRAFECRKGERPGKALFVDSDGIVNEQCEPSKLGQSLLKPRHYSFLSGPPSLYLVTQLMESALLSSRKGKEKVTYATGGKRALVQPLRDRNIGVVIRNEQDNNVAHVNEQSIEATARKWRATRAGKENENLQAFHFALSSTFVWAQVGNVISNVALAQRARRERELLLKQSTTHRSDQRLPGDCEPDNNVITINEVAPAGNEISKASWAQRARRERERILKQSLPGYLQLRHHTNLPSLTPRRRHFDSLEQEPNATTVTLSAQRRKMVSQSVASSSYGNDVLTAPRSPR
ncbi:hypothetical protein Vadar_028025 [Vaccinium darrowii]|uniref:Uncharacterized protein n=1 Tax=Vaccinium darrowii TaxID=229202 RepID=A0ACB7Z771_9ERIC|nr:hypothetical protein Vadar_028025 [Vaccinium darrowii]